MKVAFCALLALALSACSTLAPKYTVHVIPAAEPVQTTVVQAELKAATALPAPLVEQEAPELTDQVAVGPPPLDPSEVRCMAMNMYHEARGEGDVGMIAVGYVVTNRMESTKYKPTTACGIISQGQTKNGHLIKNRCQFNWMCDGRDDLAADLRTYDRAVKLAEQVLRKQVRNPIGKSLYYHESNLKWKYAARFTRVARIGNHVFYV